MQGTIQKFGEKYPAILPKDHDFTKLAVMDYHRVVLHGGVNDTLAEVRENFWIVKGRQFVKKIIKDCIK